MAAARLSEGLGTFLEWTAAQTESHHIKTAAIGGNNLPFMIPFLLFSQVGQAAAKG